MNNKQRKNLITIVVICIGIVFMVAFYYYASQNQDEFYAMRDKANNIVQPIVESAEEQGLKDVTVELRQPKGYDFYEADITCSNFGDFSPVEMYNIYKSIKFRDIGNRVIFGGMFILEKMCIKYMLTQTQSTKMMKLSMMIIVIQRIINRLKIGKIQVPTVN